MSKVVKIIFIFAAAIWLIEAELQLKNQDDLYTAMRQTFTNTSLSGWVLLEYDNKYTVEFTKKGTGGADEVRPNLKDNNVVYFVIREQIEANNGTSQNYRDVCIAWAETGPGTTPAQKSKEEEFRPQAFDFIQPCSGTLTASNIGNVDDRTIVVRADPNSENRHL